MDARRLSRAIITIARDFNRSGFCVGTSGNLSARHARGFCITPSAVPCHALAPEDMEKRPARKGRSWANKGHARLGGNVLNKPLDSGLRRNDGGAGVRNSTGMAKGLSGWRQTRSDPRCHSSEGWNPGRRRRCSKRGQVLPSARLQLSRLLSFPLRWECLESTTGFRPAPE